MLPQTLSQPPKAGLAVWMRKPCAGSPMHVWRAHSCMIEHVCASLWEAHRPRHHARLPKEQKKKFPGVATGPGCVRFWPEERDLRQATALYPFLIRVPHTWQQQCLSSSNLRPLTCSLEAPECLSPVSPVAASLIRLTVPGCPPRANPPSVSVCVFAR